jgi:hypothetical protein
VEYRERRCLELVHGDLCGPIALTTLRGNKYLLLMDDPGTYMWVAAILSKDRVAAAMKGIQAWAKGESNLKLNALHTDHSGEFTVRLFAEYCTTEGVHHQHTAPYNLQQNDIVECQNGTVVATAKSKLKAKGLPGWF